MALSPAAPSSKPVDAALQPSGSLLTLLGEELRRHPPFDDMDPAHVRAFVEGSRQAYFAPGEALVQPEDGPAQELFFIRRGAVVGKRGLSDVAGGAFQYEAGDLFPISAVLAQRATTTAYHATEDTFVLRLPAPQMHALAQQSPVFGDFLNRRVLRFPGPFPCRAAVGLCVAGAGGAVDGNAAGAAVSPDPRDLRTRYAVA